MTEHRYLSLEQVLTIHQRAIEVYGGSTGLRDSGALDSALAQPRASFEGVCLHPTIFDQAAAYLFHVTQNHPFIDGNKRTGVASAVTFLRLNGFQLNPAANDALEEITWALARGEVDKPVLATFFRAHCI